MELQHWKQTALKGMYSGSGGYDQHLVELHLLPTQAS
jgi:hypothetical protein